MASIGSASLAVIPSFKGFGAAVNAGTNREMAAAGAMGGRKFGSSFKSALKLGGFVGGISAALGVGSFIKDSIELEASYSKTMSQIRVATASPKEELERLDDLAVKLGKDTIFSAGEASGAMLELAKNGITPAVIEAGALKSALTLATAGDMPLVEAAKTMGNALQAFGLKGKDSASVASALAGAANASSADVADLAQGLAQVSSAAADSGFTLQETTGALAAFSNRGIQGSDAGTSLKTALQRLIPMTKKAEGVMKQYGLLTYDAAAASKDLAEMGLKPLGKGYAGTYKAIEKYLVQQGVAEEGTVKLADAVEEYMTVSGIMRNDFLKKNGDFKDLADIAGELDEAFAGLSDSERAAALNNLFGSDARRAATVLMAEGKKGIEDYIKATSDQRQADKMAKASMEGTAGAIEELAGSWETAKLQFGKALAPVAKEALDYIADNVDKMGPALETAGSWISKTGVPAMKKFAGFAKDAAGFAGDLVGFLGKLPSEAKIAGLVALVGGVTVSKLRGGNSGALGTAGKVLGIAKPVPVIVMNKGFGAGGGLPAGAGGGTTKVPPVVAPNGSTLAKGSRFLKFAPLLPAAGALGNDQLPDLMTDKQAKDFERYHANIKRATNFWTDHERILRDGTIPTVDLTHEKFRDLFGMAEKVDKSDPKINLFLDGYGDLTAKLRKIEGDLNWIARPRYIRMIATVQMAEAGYQTRGGLQATTEGARGGVTVNVGKVEAKDYDDLMTQLQRKAHRAALEGRR